MVNSIGEESDPYTSTLVYVLSSAQRSQGCGPDASALRTLYIYLDIGPAGSFGNFVKIHFLHFPNALTI